MKLRILLTLTFLIALSAAPAMAQIQPDPTGVQDTVALVASVEPVPGAATSQLVVDLWVYNDEALSGATAGFTWDNPKIQMDSAVGQPTLVAGFDLARFYFENNDISLTNANQRFLIGGASLFSGGITADASTRRLWAKYYFTVTDWTDQDAVTFDTLTFNSGSAWLFVNPPTNLNFLPTWNGAITVGNQVIPSSLALSVTSLTYNATQGGANPANQTFDVTSSNDPLEFTAAKTQPWLTVDPTGGTTPQTVTASVDITGMTAGTYYDTVTVDAAAADNSPQTVAITLNIAEPPLVIATSPDTLYFSAVEGGADPAGQMMYVTEQLDRNVAFSALENSTRLSLSKTSGTTPDSIMVSSLASGLTPGTYLDSVIVNAPTATNSPQMVYAQLTVEPAPPKVLVVSPDTLFFTAEESGPETDSQYIYVSEQGGDNLPFTVSGANEWVLMTDTTGTTPDSVAVSVLPGSLAVGTHLFTLDVNAPDADNTPQTAYVQITITPRPRMLVVNPVSLNFSGTAGVPITDSMYFAVTESGGDNVTYTVVDTTAWVIVNPTDGTTPDSNWVKVDNTGLAAGSYSAVLSVESGEAANSPQLVVVHLTLSPPENQPPVIDPIEPQVTDEGSALTFLVHATDPDGTFPTLTAFDMPEGANFFDSANGTGIFQWTPNYDQAGVYYPYFIASDGVLQDSMMVEITVNNVNRAPVITFMPNDTTIDECMSVFEYFTAMDPDGDPIIMYLDQTYPNMVFEDSAMGSAYLLFDPDTTQAGVYPLTLTVSDGTDSVYGSFTITVTDCTPPPGCVDIVFPDTIVQIFDTVGTPNNPAVFLPIYSSGAEFCYTVADLTEGPMPSFAIVDSAGCTPDSIMVTYDKTDLPAGDYLNSFVVFGDSTVCDPAQRGFTVLLNIIDTTTNIVELDTLAVGTVPAVPGATVEVPVTFINHCDLYAIQALIDWNTPYLTLDSINYAGSGIIGGAIADSIDNDLNWVALMLNFPEGWVAPGEWLYGNLYFTVAQDAPAGFYPLDLASSPFDNPIFATNCADSVIGRVPDFIPGGIVVDSATNFVCGYVVDTAGMPIANAHVELWGEFPVGSPDMSTMSDTSGYFAFYDVNMSPIDLYGYKDGYYPGLVQNVNFGQNGIMIVLTPVAPVYPTYEWVNFYCDNDLYFGQPLPVGSVIDAYDPDGVRCGTYTVTEAGKYGFMPVYRDDPYMEGDQGAEPGDNIRFFINGVEAQAYGETVWTTNGDSWQVCLEGGEFTTECQLHEGWNLVSWRIDTESDYIEDALASIADHIELVLGFEQGGLTFDPNLPQFSTLWNVDHLSGYWIKVDADVTLEMTGAAVAVSTPIPVTAGWNLVAYLPDYSMPITDALQSLDGNTLVSLGFDNGGQVYLPGDSLHNTLDQMSPCMGYWVKVQTDGVLIYPGTGPVVAPQHQPLGQVAKVATGVTPTTQWMNLYAEHLTLDNETVAAGSRIDAYTTSGIKIGSFTMHENGIFGFMPVYADDQRTSELDGVKVGDQFTLTVNDVPVNETFTFTAAGDRVELFNLTAKTENDPILPNSFSLSQNYPNPFNPTTTISFSLPAPGKARLEVFNVLGKLVATPFDGTAAAGETQVVWDGTNEAGSHVASGIYFYRLSADNYTETKKMVLMK